MKSVLIGSAAYASNWCDIDLIADQHFVNHLKRNLAHIETIYDGEPRTYGTLYAWRWKPQGTNKEQVIEVTLPKPGTAYEMVLDAARVKEEINIKTLFPGNFILKVPVAQAAILCALKKAHLIHPHKWHHHIKEYRYLKELFLGLTDNNSFNPTKHGPQPITKDIFKLHRQEILAISKPHPKLNTTKGEFFEESDFKIFDHDDIHKAIALGDTPAYTLMIDGEVWVSRRKWRRMTEEQRFNCVLEEASVLALERVIIPSLYLDDVCFRGAKWAFEHALFKICTTITSGWFRDYCIERYWHAVRNRPDFVNAFFEGFKRGEIRILKPEVVCGTACT